MVAIRSTPTISTPKTTPSATIKADLGRRSLLKRGSSGVEVAGLQKKLQSQGLYKGAIDGKFGPQTDAAVKAFQEKRGLQVDGKVGQQTWGSLLHNAKLPPGSSMLGQRAGHAAAAVTKDGYEKSSKSNPYTPKPTAQKSGVSAQQALGKYGNGRIPAHELTPIGVGNHRLYGPAADAFKRMRADAAKDGVNLGVTDSYRSYAAQVDVARRKGLYKNGGLAATPGRSKHGWGLAVDLKLDGKASRWMRANAAKYGFKTIPREPWHWEFRR